MGGWGRGFGQPQNSNFSSKFSFRPFLDLNSMYKLWLSSLFSSKKSRAMRSDVHKSKNHDFSLIFADFGRFGEVKCPISSPTLKLRSERFSRKIKIFQIGQKIRKSMCLKYSKKNIRLRFAQKPAFWTYNPDLR